MRSWLMGVGLVALAGSFAGYAGTACAQSPAPSSTPRAPAGPVPKSGVITPLPDATSDPTVKPPNVDPGMTVVPAIVPPGAQGTGGPVVPK